MNRSTVFAAALIVSFVPALLSISGCAENLTAPAAPAAMAAPAPPPDLASNPPPSAPDISTDRPTIFVAGDSTAARGAGAQQQGWGVPFAAYFDPAKVNVVDGARGGRSSRTFVTEGLWERLLARVRPGDIVLIQFGVNDAGAINDNSRARGSLPGLGAETREIDNLLTGKHEVVHTYGWYLSKMIADTQAKGARPIVLSLTVRDIWKNGRVDRDRGRYNEWAAEVAQAAGVPFVDVTDLAADQFELMGEDKMKALYPRDDTHFNATGADLHAAAVVSGLKGLPSNPVGKLLSARGKAVEADRCGPLKLPVPANPTLPTLFLIGDSTVRNGFGDGRDGLWGWGDYVGTNFDAAKINVVNRAVGGTSSRTFLTQGYWDRVLAMLHRGDFVMMQFGHNDGGALNDDSRARGTIKGVGEETQEIDNLLTKRHETVHSYGWYLRRYIADARARGATPIVCSLIPRKIWKDGKIVRNKGDYAGWAEQVATAEGVAFIDLNEIIARRYDELGPAKVEPLFGDPHTHTTAAGAALNADCVTAGLRTLPVDPLASFLRAGNP
jgi:lysophospholipase L1-like esterase